MRDDATIFPRGATVAPARSLHGPVRLNSCELVKPLLAHDVSPNLMASPGTTPLHLAAQGGNEEMVRLLLNAGSDPTARTPEGLTARTLAERAGFSTVAQMLGA
jgi:ankyrin repeat protein